MNKHPCCTFYTLRTWLSICIGNRWPGGTDQVPTVNAIHQSVIRLSEKLARLKKQPNWDVREQQISLFLDELYCFPKVQIFRHGEKADDFSTSTLDASSSSHSICSSCSASDTDKEILVEINQQLCKEISDLKKCASVSALEQKVMLSRNRMYDQHHNDMKKLKRRNKKIEEYKKENTETKKTLSQMEVQLHKNDYRIAELVLIVFVIEQIIGSQNVMIF